MPKVISATDSEQCGWSDAPSLLGKCCAMKSKPEIVEEKRKAIINDFVYNRSLKKLRGIYMKTAMLKPTLKGTGNAAWSNNNLMRECQIISGIFYKNESNRGYRAWSTYGQSGVSRQLTLKNYIGDWYSTRENRNHHPAECGADTRDLSHHAMII